MQTENAIGLALLHEDETFVEAVQQASLKSDEDTTIYKLKGDVGLIRVREIRSEGLSFQIWPAAHALCCYLEETYGAAGMFSSHASSVNRPEKSASLYRNMRVLELGAGTGMVGILCAVIGAHCTITDLPHVIPNLEHNARLNENVIRSSGHGGSVTVRSLRWGEQTDLEAVGCCFDLIVASDVVYQDHLFEPLLCTLKWLLYPPSCNMSNGNAGAEALRNNNFSSSHLSQEGVFSSFAAPDKEAASTPQFSARDNNVERCTYSFRKGSAEKVAHPIVLLAHLRRWKKDSQFFKKAAKLFQSTVVYKHAHDANPRTGVTVYSFSRKQN